MGQACCSIKNPNTLDLGPKTTKEQRKKAKKKDKDNKKAVPDSSMDINKTPQN